MSNSNPDTTYSFVIPTFNEERYIEQTIRDIRENFRSSAVGFEIVVADNGSSDGTIDIAEGLGCICIVEPEFSISELRNAGARKSSGRILVFIDSDVSLSQDWLENVSPYLESLLCGPSHILGSHYQPFGDTPRPLYYWFVGGYENPRTSFLPGGHTILSRTSFETIGGFDPSFSTSEDIDFCHRATKLGFEILHRPEIGVVHRGDPQTVRQFLKRECWHGGSDFESLHRVFSSLTSLATLFFVLAHAAVLFFALAGIWTGVLVSMAGILGLLVFTSFYLFKKSSVRLKLTNIVNAYLYYLGRCCSIRALFVKSRRDQ